jgi:regulatory protein
MACRLLARRDHSRLELQRKLVQRGVDGDTAEDVVAHLEEQGLVSDERFAEVFVRQRVERLQGPMRIRQELRARGVADEDIRRALEPFDESWHERARRWVARRHDPEGAETLDRKARARLYRGGQQRGFSHDQIMRAIEWLAREEAREG